VLIPARVSSCDAQRYHSRTASSKLGPSCWPSAWSLELARPSDTCC